jgi:hypothetical protein
MATPMNSGGGGGSTPLDFTSAASVEPEATELVERKVCEGLCGGCFFRPVPASAREGEKICAACRAKLRPSEVPAKWDSRRGDLFNMREVKQYRRAS